MRKSIRCYLLLTVILGTLMFSITAHADGIKCRTCGDRLNTGATYHNENHTDMSDWSDYDETYHVRICMTCLYAGHSSECTEIYSEKEAHTFPAAANADGYYVCTVCGYEKKAECQHKNTFWRGSLGRDEELVSGVTCDVQWCSDCNQIIAQKAHDYSNKADSEDENYCYTVTCTRCKNSITKSHNLKKQYIQNKATSSYIKNSTGIGSSHKIAQVCTVCGYKVYSGVSEEPHTYVSNKCKYCGYVRKIGPKTTIKSATGSYAGSKTVRTNACWRWSINKWTYYPAGSYKNYYYKINLKWKKSAGAKAYVVSTQKITKGDVYVANAVVYKTVKCSKTSMTYKITSTKRVKSTKIYIAQVNKDGIIGKVTSKKVTF